MKLCVISSKECWQDESGVWFTSGGFPLQMAGGRNLMLATGVGASPPAPRMHWLFSTAVTQNEVDAVQPDLDRPRKTPPRLAFVGRLSPVKGLVPLVEAMALLRDEGGIDGGPPHLTIMGDGPLRSELEMLVKRHRCDDLIQFTGQLNRSELVGHLLQADLCVQPSLSEGFCKALLDAMLCGVPVLATDVGANRQILGEDGQRGWILPGVEPSLLAGEIRRRLQEPLDWPALRRRCHAYVEEHTLEAWSQRIADLCAEQWKIALPNGKQRA